MTRTALERVTKTLGAPVPARDLPFVDAVAVLVAVAFAYCARAATNGTFPLTWAGVAPYVRHALPVCLAALLLSAAAVGLYGARAATGQLWQYVAAVGYTTAIVGFVGAFWASQFPPTLVLVPGALALLVTMYAGRRLYWRAAELATTVA